MSGAYFMFETSAFNDSAHTRAQSINGIVGHTLATSLMQELEILGFNVSDAWPEDHGWDFWTLQDEAHYLCACSIEHKLGQVSLHKPRSLWDRISGKNKFTDDDAVACGVFAALGSMPD